MATSNQAMKQGLLIANLGSPDAPTTSAVRRYLQQFLMDPEVIDIPVFFRALLVYGPISLFRASKSAHAYASIWTERGSPLVCHAQDLAALVRDRLPEWSVAVGMRYGNPSLESGLRELQEAGVTEYHVASLYPQYAMSSTSSLETEARRAAARLGIAPAALKLLRPFYGHPEFIGALAERTRPFIEDASWDRIQFSYHGIPERHLRKLPDCGTRCLAEAGCCASVRPDNRDCYRAQSFETTRLLKKRLGLADARTGISFQSRLGRTPWIQPFTDEVLKQLAGDGVKRIAVLCPSFVADCLETLEEIGMRERETFLEHGGEELKLIPCLNAEPVWADAFVRIVTDQGAWIGCESIRP
jgi:ferrochelatase